MTPWDPALNGKDLQPCLLIQDLVEGRCVPNPHLEEDAPWSLVGLRGQVEKVPEVKEALVECVVALWRLMSTQEQGVEDDNWRDHLVAWLVRG